MDKIESFKKELKELLAKYNVEIYACSDGEGFNNEIIIDIDWLEVFRVKDTLSQWDIE